jgi:hypothetical protein
VIPKDKRGSGLAKPSSKEKSREPGVVDASREKVLEETL